MTNDTDDTDDELPARLVAPGPGGQGRTFWEVTPRGLAIIEELVGRGCHLATVARVLGMHGATLREVRRRDPAVEEAYQRGLAREHDVLVGGLRAAANEGNIAAAIYLLKCRHGMWDQPTPASVQVNVDTSGVLVVPPKMSVAEFLEERRAAGGRIPGQPDPDVIDAVPEGVRGD